jgi:hypothetical protein
MSDSFQQLLTLLTTFRGQDDVIVDPSHPDLRLNLLPETIDLWGNAYAQAAESDGNLLLACTSSTGPIEEASLTWVVGSAIRSIHVDGRDACQLLLQALGLEPALAEAIIRHCPGIADNSVWALYYERHGHLVATPVLSVGLGREVAASIPSLKA